MPFLLWLGFEVVVFWFIGKTLGFGWTFLLYFAPILLGLLLLSTVSRSFMISAQKQVSRGEVLAGTMIKLGCRMAAGVLFLFPFFAPRAIGLMLLLPGAGFLAFGIFQSWILKKIKRGQFVFTQVQPDFRGNQGKPFGFEQEPYRDVYETSDRRTPEVIDLPPESVTIKS
jgi:UPF0716 family protein affecting phage T7 exclusion